MGVYDINQPSTPQSQFVSNSTINRAQGGLTMKRLVEESGATIRVQEYTDVAKNSKQRGVTIRGNLDVSARVVRGALVDSTYCSACSNVSTHSIVKMDDRRSSRRSGRSWTCSGNDGRRQRCVWRVVTVCPRKTRSIDHSNHDATTDRRRGRRRRRARWCGARRCGGSSPRRCRAC